MIGNLEVHQLQEIKKTEERTGDECQLSVRWFTEKLSVNHAAIHHVFIRELETRKYFAKFMTKNLTPGQRTNRKEVFCDLLEQIENDPLFLSNVIPRDEI